ncbi:MAG: hypothetical protein WA364_08755 [Candidatus Nitrosopolaris sp.]
MAFTGRIGQYLMPGLGFYVSSPCASPALKIGSRAVMSDAYANNAVEYINAGRFPTSSSK